MGRIGRDPSRREWLRTAASASALPALLGPGSSASGSNPSGSVILLVLTGGPGSLDTFDPKPGAPEAIRGPFGSIATALPGVRVSEHLPRLARRLDRVTLIRTLHHDGPPTHEAGLGLLGIGGEVPPGRSEPVPVRRTTPEAYGRSGFGRSCFGAARRVEAGARFVVVHQAASVLDRPSWDAHGRRPFSTFDDLEGRLLPDFDAGFSALIDDLGSRGLLDSTLVVAVGEVGRTPRINESGGRDHWTHAWSAVVAGATAPRGAVIGATGPDGARPVDRPFPLAELAGWIGRTLGVEPDRARV